MTRTDDGARLVTNRQARRDAPWTSEQDAILNDDALARARATITAWPGYAPTPLVSLPAMAREAGVAEIRYKDEGARFGLGSFKALGGAYAVARLLVQKVSEQTGSPVSTADILSGAHAAAVRELTVCCATDGNHGRSVAWGARTFGCRCVIFVHETVSEGRKAAIEHYGAEVRRCSGNYDDSVRIAGETAAAEGWTVVSDTSYPGYMEIPRDVMQGYEVMAEEAFDALSARPTHIILQTGVGGMAAAIVALAKRRWGADRPRILLTDPALAACWVASFSAAAPVAVTGDLDTLMAGLACGEVSALAWEILHDHADAAMAVDDDAAIAMMRRLSRGEGGDPALVAGESAVAGLVGLLEVAADPEARALVGLDADARVLVFGTEGDTDPELYARLVGISGDEVRHRAAA